MGWSMYCCETCNQWYHINSQSMHRGSYDILANDSTVDWDCVLCEYPNYSTCGMTCHSVCQTNIEYYQIIHWKFTYWLKCIQQVQDLIDQVGIILWKQKNTTPWRKLNVNLMSIKKVNAKLKIYREHTFRNRNRIWKIGFTDFRYTRMPESYVEDVYLLPFRIHI